MYYDDSAENKKDRLAIPPEQNFKGMSYGGWAAAWSNWLFSEDADRNEAQGSMLFLRGNIESYGNALEEKSTPYGQVMVHSQDNTSFYNRTGDRCVVIPRGKAIFIPVLTTTNFIGSQYEGKTSNSEDQIRYAAQTETDKSGGVWALIQRLDRPGEWEPIVKDLLHHRIASPVFTIKISETSAFLEQLTLAEHIVAGEYQAVTEGFFIILKSLPHDTCRLQFGGKGRELNYHTNSIYDIHITDDGRSQVLVMDVTPDIVKGDPNTNLANPKAIKKEAGDGIPALAKLPG
jgi:hypothetical protein